MLPPEGEIPGRYFAQRVARSLTDAPSITRQEWFRLYRIVVPRTRNGKGGPRPLEEAWQARRLRAEGSTRRAIALAVGYITPADVQAAEDRSPAYVDLLRSAEKRITRNEELLAACGRRIVDAGLDVPRWLTHPGVSEGDLAPVHRETRALRVVRAALADAA